MKRITKIQIGFIYLTLVFIGFLFNFRVPETKADANWFVAQSPLLTDGVNYSVSSPFWAPRSFGGSSPHGGIDIVHHGAPGSIYGDPVYSMADGEIVKIVNSCADVGYVGNSCGGQYGNHVVTYHGEHKVIDQDGKEVVSDIFLLFGHLKKGSTSGIKVGQKIKAGEKIGEVASSGSSTGHHLHVSVYAPGKGVGPKGNIYGGTKASAKPYIWPEGGQYETSVAFKPTATMYNALGELAGEGSGASNGTNLANPDEVFEGSDAWKDPLVDFKTTEYAANPKGVESNKGGLVTNNLVVAFTNTSNHILKAAYVVMFFMVAAFIAYMAFITIFYLVLLPRGNATHKLSDIFEKTTGIEAIYDRKGVKDIIARDIFSIFGIAFLLSGAYIKLFSAIYQLISYLF